MTDSYKKLFMLCVAIFAAIMIWAVLNYISQAAGFAAAAVIGIAIGILSAVGIIVFKEK